MADDSNDQNGNKSKLTTNIIIWRALQGLVSLCLVIFGGFIVEISKDLQKLDNRIVAIENSRWKARDQAEYMRMHDLNHTEIMKLLTTVAAHVNDDRMHKEARTAFTDLHKELNAIKVSLAQIRSDVKSLANGHEHN